jgi:shikimate dehydrogenase
MQNAALHAAGLRDWRYQLLPVPPALFRETVQGLAGANFRGANVTLPHKPAALELADHASARARAIGAANTLLFSESGGVEAENTDAPALIEALPFPADGATALVLGAGGSARAAVWALIDAGASEVRVWNRTPERAEDLTAELGGVAVSEAGPADLLVHCTSSGLDASDSTFKRLPIEADDLHRYRCVVDFVYSQQETELVQAARARSIGVVDGLQLLLGQGALSFELFTGNVANRKAMRMALDRR